MADKDHPAGVPGVGQGKGQGSQEKRDERAAGRTEDKAERVAAREAKKAERIAAGLPAEDPTDEIDYNEHPDGGSSQAKPPAA